ncbi:MAG: isopeptide-forming domain-containing fimbrial protein, partial [Anaerolineales bacterium]
MSFLLSSRIADRLRFIFQFVFILMFLAGQSVWGNTPVSAAPSERPLAASTPSVSLNVPAEVFIGNNVNFTVTFDNPDPTDPGYGPIIDLIIPTNGADGAQNTNPPLDGLTFVSATYLGTSVESTVLTFPGSGGVTCVNHPYIVDNTGNPVQVCGDAGDTFVALRLPFGSFTPQQPPVDINVTVSMSNLADLGAPLTIQARGGYQFGYTPLNDYTTDPPNATLSAWTSGSVTPILFTLEKTYNGPEDETATGPNFPRRYTVTAAIAPGQTISPFNLSDVLPNNMQFVSLVSTNPGGATCTLPSTTTPGGTLSCNFTSVSGTVTMTFEYYIPLRDSGGGSVIDPTTGDDATSCNNASGGGTWTPIDSRDAGGTFTQDPPGCEHTLTDKSIAIQKSVSVVGGGNAAPGKYLEYTLDFQISDFFAFNNIVITDVISDGQHFAPGFVPTLQINGNGYTLAALAMGDSNVTTSCNYTGATASPPAPPGECDSLDPAPNDGATTIVFDVSQEIIDRGQDGRLIGGCVPTTGTGGDPDCSLYNDGPTTGRIVFRTLIQENFTDTYPSGDPSVDQGDVLGNAVNINGNVLSTSDASTPTGQSEADTSAASVQIGRGALTKTIYAVNGSTSFSSPVHVSPGDTVTYRLRYTLPTSDFEDLVFTDYLPLPVFNATEVTTFLNSACGIPAAGVSCLGPADTYNTLPGAVSPALSTNAADNWVRWTYGDYDSTSNSPSMIDLLFTVTVSNQPFADGLYLTNQGFAQEGSTNSSSSTSTGIIQIILDEPAVVNLSKGVVWTNNPNGVFTPPTVGPVTFNGTLGCPAWSGGNITSSGLASNPVNSNLSNVDAADQVMMAIILENTGHASAFDVKVRDSLPPGMTYVPNSLCVTDGTGAAFVYLSGGLDGSGLFDADGIELVDPGPTNPPPGALDPGKDSGGNVIDNGRNIAVITYLVTLDSTVQGGQILTNTATLFNYAGSEGGPDHTAVDPTDTAQTQIRYDGLGKTFTTEIINSVNSQTEAVIGEFVDYTLTITFHEGTTPNVTLEDNLPAGLAFVDCLSITPSSADLTTNLPGGFAAACNDPANPAVASPGQNFTFTLGTITNANTDNSVDETLAIVFRAVVLNINSNQAGTNLINRATLRIDGGAGGTATVQSSPLTVIEPVVNTSKSVSPTTADAGDTVTFTVTLSNPASGSTTAYDVTWSDTVPAGLTYVPGTLALGACTASTPLTLSDAGAPTLTGSGGLFQPGESCTITFQATVDYSVTPGQVITNTAQTQWTSMSGAVSDRSPYNTDSDERDGTGGLLGSGALNDYHTQGQANVTINNTAPQKYLVATSEAH